MRDCLCTWFAASILWRGHDDSYGDVGKGLERIVEQKKTREQVSRSVSHDRDLKDWEPDEGIDWMGLGLSDGCSST